MSLFEEGFSHDEVTQALDVVRDWVAENEDELTNLLELERRTGRVTLGNLLVMMLETTLESQR